MAKLTILTDETSLRQPPQHLSGKHSPTVILEYEKRHNGDSDSDLDSLFDEMEEDSHTYMNEDVGQVPEMLPASDVRPPSPADKRPAQRLGPPIPGLYFNPHAILPEELAQQLFQTCLTTYFQNPDVNQVMLFERVIIDPRGSSDPHAASTTSSRSSLPQFLQDLLHTLSSHLRPLIPPEIHELLFPLPGSPPRARQVIINSYRPGEGITPHVDLLERFGDGIIGVSLGSGCVMRFARALAQPSTSDRRAVEGAERKDDWSVFLPPGSVYVMSGEARYGWTHGIDGRGEDWVDDETGESSARWLARSMRVSITFRWLLPGADVVGGSADVTAQY